ncbi:hypothetical protein LSAT2_018818 [Lamellibrachia satsuma]|nr:hypothetical protein LSAT2_018818 [Lamellibrachia satsuma]
MRVTRLCNNPCKNGGTCEYLATTDNHRCVCPKTHRSTLCVVTPGSCEPSILPWSYTLVSAVSTAVVVHSRVSPINTAAVVHSSVSHQYCRGRTLWCQPSVLPWSYTLVSAIKTAAVVHSSCQPSVLPWSYTLVSAINTAVVVHSSVSHQYCRGRTLSCQPSVLPWSYTLVSAINTATVVHSSESQVDELLLAITNIPNSKMMFFLAADETLLVKYHPWWSSIVCMAYCWSVVTPTRNRMSRSECLSERDMFIGAPNVYPSSI